MRHHIDGDCRVGNLDFLREDFITVSSQVLFLIGDDDVGDQHLFGSAATMYLVDGFAAQRGVRQGNFIVLAVILVDMDHIVGIVVKFVVAGDVDIASIMFYLGIIVLGISQT